MPAFLFDMDGTLLNSVRSTERIWGAWACRHGIDVASLLRTIHGVRTRETVLRQNIPGIGIDVDAEVAAIMQAEMKGPGSMTETLMPKAATSWARESANPAIAALEAL